MPTLFPEEAAPVRVESDGCFADVCFDRPLQRAYTYAVPEELRERLVPGVRVAAPFGRRREVGVVVKVADRCDVPLVKLKWITRLLDDEPVIGSELLELTRWMAERYACSWGETLAAVLPAPLKRESGSRQVLEAEVRQGIGPAELEQLETRFPKQHRLLRTLVEVGGPVELRDILRRLNLSDSPARSLQRRGWIRIRRVDARPDELFSSYEERPKHARLTEAQEKAVAAIASSLDARVHRTFLLQGVTGSGKTEVYLRVIERAVEQGRGAIVLVPEIALTPQTIGWFRSRFGSIAVLHSRMTDAQRLGMWLRVKRGEARVVVGARSAVFAPVDDLGVVVVDEEHEPSFKQENIPRYHARTVAIERARGAGAVCVLGSATPAIESWWRAGKGEYERLLLPKRIGSSGMPSVDLVDMRLESRRGATPLFSRLLRNLLQEAVEEGEQAILFLNRRGFTTTLWCPGCEATVHCDRCDVALTYHRRIKRLVCHQCCSEKPLVFDCPTCTRPGLKPLGAGSERVESELLALLPEARVRRMDSDTMRRREDYEDTLAAFGRGEVDVLVGTQMIAKGLDFPNVTIVGIISADQSLRVSDFRSAERTFQLIAQVAGRAGRGDRPGRIVVQTIEPQDPSIRFAVADDYEAFMKHEDVRRAELWYPPHGELIRVLFDDPDEARVVDAARKVKPALCALPGASEAMIVLGPISAPLSMLRGRYRHHVLVKAIPGSDVFAEARSYLLDLALRTSRPRIIVDVDPVSML
ncbi:MAG: primosomal protein N' [Planctomycetota bacterium]|nr:primosomal protein N' [Planctomycetota bacterium]